MLHINVDDEFEQEMIQAIVPKIKIYIENSYEKCFEEVIGAKINKEKAHKLFSFVVYDFMSKYLNRLAEESKQNKNLNIKTSFDPQINQVIH